ncbi:MAG: trehalase family glycosidase [Bacteroidota bacterium]
MAQRSSPGSVLVISSLLLSFIVQCGQLDPSSENAGPTNLTVEFIREPGYVLIADSKPEFGWQVRGAVAEQQAYQVLVASTSAQLLQDEGDIWDSGKTASRRSFGIEYTGEPLAPGSTYYWKVRLWGANDVATRYSESQRFTIGPKGADITTPNRFQKALVPPSTLEQRGRNFFADFGKAAFGTLQLTYATDTADTLLVRLGEQLEADGNINQDPGGHIRFAEVQVPITPSQKEYVVELPKDQRNTNQRAVALPDSFPVVMPFRYCEIVGALDISDGHLRQVRFHSYFDDDQSHFSSSDTVLNQVWDLCKYSIKATTFAGLYVDGDRERIPYEADAYINQLSHYAVDAEYAITRRTIEYFMREPTWPTEWQLHVAMMFYDDYMYTGSRELIEKYYEPLKHKTLIGLARADGLITTENVTPELMTKLGFTDPKVKLRDIVDWPPANWGNNPDVPGERDNYVFRPINTVVNSFYYRNMEIMAFFAELLGKPEEQVQFEAMAAKAREAINTKLFDQERGYYIDGEGTEHASLHANMLPLAFGLVPEGQLSSVVAFIKSRGMACSVYGAQYLMDGLYRAGEADYALELMTATHDRSWWNMIAVGSTITMEAWDMKYKPNADWNHAWGAVPGNAIARGLWGIKPKTPGAQVVTIEPQLSTLRSSEIYVPFQTGQVVASYEASQRKYEIVIPNNMRGEFRQRDTGPEGFLLNGEPITSGFPLTLEPGRHEITLP